MKPNLLIISLSFIASFLVPASSTDPKITDCVPKSCGSLTNVSYPFWINGKQPSYCGFPQFQLSCINDISSIPASFGGYLVKEIFYPNQSLIVVPESTPTCPLLYSNLTFNLTTFFISSSNRELFYSNCTKLRNSNWFPVTCGERTFAYLGGKYEVGEHLGLAGGCDTWVVPVMGYPGANGSDYDRLIKDGFVLEWSVADCTDCRASNGQCGYNSETKSFMCICSDRTNSRGCRVNNGNKRIVGLAAGIGGFLFMCLVFFLYLFRHKTLLKSKFFHRGKPNNEQTFMANLEKYGSLAPKRYKYSEVKKMTKSFSDKLGQGGYGTVFKGSLKDGHLVAVKVLIDSKGNGEEFINEVRSIGRTSHVNIVYLLGFCLEGSKRALVYDYMPNGSLEKYKNTIGWEDLYQIAIGIARGLEYLHHGCNTPMVHFDIKPNNILLDQEFRPKIADFGLAKLSSTQDSKLSMAGARGTIGYIAPELISREFGVVSSKCDVYSYGMLLLEMVGVRQPVDANTDQASEIYFPHWIYEHMNNDGNLQAWGVTNETEEIARKMIVIGLWCIQSLPGNRPSMSRVIDMLVGSSIDLQMPPEPYLSATLKAIHSAPSISISNDAFGSM